MSILCYYTWVIFIHILSHIAWQCINKIVSDIVTIVVVFYNYNLFWRGVLCGGPFFGARSSKNEHGA